MIYFHLSSFIGVWMSMRVTIWVYWCYFSGGEDKKNDLGVGHQLQYESDTADILLLFKVAQNSNRKQNHIEDSSSNCNYNNPRNKNRVGSQLRTADFASISHGFFSQKKVDDFSQKKWWRNSSCDASAFVLRPRLLEAISAWRPGKGQLNSPWPWPIYGTPLVS